jgi:homoserine kinase
MSDSSSIRGESLLRPSSGQEVKQLTVSVPGSSANLGPGFDTLALAFKLYCHLNFRLLEEDDRSIPLITLKGVISDGLPKDQNNLIYTILSNLWQNDPELLTRVRISIESEIPLGKGVGSSAAAIMGAVWAAYALTQSIPDNSTLLSTAARLEGHADNVAASLLGGLVVSARSLSTKGIVTQKLAWPEEWRTILVVPPYVLSTKKARSILPANVSFHDAVANVQRVSLLTAAVANRDEDAMKEALSDRLHEPYRQILVPELGSVRRLLSDFPIIGCVLSGAGSSVLTVVNQRHAPQVVEALRKWAQSQSQPPEVLDLNVDHGGLRVRYE